MFNKHLTFEAEIPNGSKVVAFTKSLSLRANLTFKVKVKVNSFKNRPRPLDDQYTAQV